MLIYWNIYCTSIVVVTTWLISQIHFLKILFISCFKLFVIADSSVVQIICFVPFVFIDIWFKYHTLMEKLVLSQYA